MNNFVSVIIPTYHDWDRLKLCVNALEQQTYSKDMFEVIVVNNDPSDIPPSFNLPNNFHIINEDKPGSYAARNAGLAIAKGEIIAFTDSDCIPNIDWLENAVTHLNNGSERLAGKVEMFYKADKLTWGEIYDKAYAFDQKTYASLGTSVTANMITWKKHFNELGLFNDQLMSGGDMEWGYKAQEHNIPITLANDVIVKHPARIDLSEHTKKAKRTAGGAINIKHLQSNQGLLSFLREFAPPLKRIVKTFRRNDLTIREKMIASSLLYYLKLYVTFVKIKLRTGLTTPSRS